MNHNLKNAPLENIWREYLGNHCICWRQSGLEHMKDPIPCLRKHLREIRLTWEFRQCYGYNQTSISEELDMKSRRHRHMEPKARYRITAEKLYAQSIVGEDVLRDCISSSSFWSAIWGLLVRSGHWPSLKMCLEANNRRILPAFRASRPDFSPISEICTPAGFSWRISANL